MPEPFAPFARRLTRGYALLAVALIALIVATTSVLAFLLYVGTLNEAIASDAQRIAQDALAYQRQHKSPGTYDAALAKEIAGPRVGVRIYDERHRLVAASDGGSAAGDRLTRIAAAVFGLHSAVLHVDDQTIVVAPELARFNRLLARYLAVVLPIGALAVLLAWLAGRNITRRAIAPLQAVASALRRIAGGNFAPEPLPAGDSSLRELTTAYNDVAQRLTAATVERERNELQMRQFVADAGHELRTPLTIVMGYLEILQQGIVGDAAAVGNVYETMLSESRRMRAVIDKLILLARLERPALPSIQVVDVAALAARVVTAMAPLAGANRVEVIGAGSACIVEADETELYEALKNVVENAVRYAPESPIAVDVACRENVGTVTVTDRGPGMDATDAEHAFDRFYRGGARTAEGSGLGLSIAKRAVERVGGTVALESEPGVGTRVTISLPRGSTSA
ncbi:MAG: HAMP domain-containing histidine kinase [Candidatus Eremiobacteraeota bacterium]|nr:HAMP domain-containing histidine kinase [Candidatus Eremiobacteraeota bacterium]